MRKNNDVIYVVRLKRDFFKRVKRAAAVEDLRAAQFIRRALRRELEAPRQRRGAAEDVTR